MHNLSIAMPISQYEITNEQVAKLLALMESHFLDFKSKEITPSKLTKSISAFANADGGELYIGISENKAEKQRIWSGFGSVEDANGAIQIFEKLFPLGQDFDYQFLESPGCQGLVLRIAITKTPGIKRASDQFPYIRRGAQNLPVQTPEAMRTLEFAKGISSFESELVRVDHEVISNSLKVIEFMLEIIPTAEPEAWLRKQNLIRENFPAVAGVLLFADEPQALIPKHCSIKIYRYKTSAEAGTRETLDFDPITIEGSIYDQIYSAVRKTTEIIETLKIAGPTSLESVRYPSETLHEIIANAVLHRDYSIADDIHIRIFDNRIEVESPGRLPAHITEKNILKERFSRNGTIVRLINKFPNPPNKDVGEGLNTAFEAMTKMSLKEPVIRERENSVIVHIRHESLATPEQILAEYLEHNPSINNSKAREICHMNSENKMKRVFERAIQMGLIERIPNLYGRAIAYRKKGE